MTPNQLPENFKQLPLEERQRIMRERNTRLINDCEIGDSYPKYLEYLGFLFLTWRGWVILLVAMCLMSLVFGGVGRNCSDSGWLPNGTWSHVLYQMCMERR